MKTTKVTIHKMENIDGSKVEYAQVFSEKENRLLCRNIMLDRLTLQERAMATPA